MSLEEVKLLLSYLGAFGVGGVMVGVVVFLLLKSFLPSYLAQKAQNLATKEDIAQITNEIERIKSQYAFFLEELRARHQLRLAAVDRRLQAHQEAYALWRKLIMATNQDSVHSVVIECQEWWNKNCLYLSAEAREAFNEAYFAAHGHEAFRESPRDKQAIKANWEKIRSAGEKILRAVELPSIGDKETETLPIEQPESNTLLNVEGRQRSRPG